MIRILVVVPVLMLAGSSRDHLFAQESEGHPYSSRVWASCREFLEPKKVVDGKSIGQEECLMQERQFVFQERKYRRADMGITGTIEGYALKSGAMAAYFNSDPEFVFAQMGRSGWTAGIGRYEGAAGMGISIFYPDPESTSAWNGKLYYHVHGGGLCAGDAGEDDLTGDPFRVGDVSAFDQIMLEKGYAVVRTRRATGEIARGTLISTTDKGQNCSSVRLNDGTILVNVNFTDHYLLHLGFLKVGKNFLKDRLGRLPSRTYWFGKSSGARVGQLVNLRPELNVGPDGKRLVDGLLMEDTAAGFWYPVLFKDGKDILFTSQREKDQLVKQIEIIHRLDANWRKYPLPDWVSPVNLVNKRRNAKLHMEKGLGSKYRAYEVLGSGHNGGDYGTRPGSDVVPLYLGHLMDAQMDILEDWVEKGIEPPPNRSDWPDLGDVDGDGFVDFEAIGLPEVACPLGIYFPYPPSRGWRGALSTGFAPFDESLLEPLDGRGIHVDMNRNGSVDMRESVRQAWRRLGLLKPGEKFSRGKYVNCVSTVVSKLRSEKFLTERGSTQYLEQAAQKELPAP